MSYYPPPMNVIPVTPAYAGRPFAPVRPGVITAIGVISIILAIIGMIANFGSGLFALVSMTTARVQSWSASIHDAERYQLVAPDATASPDAMPPADAATVADGLSRVRALTPARRDGVVRLAQVHGKRMFPFASGAISASRVAANVSDSGAMLHSAGARADYYVLGEGRLEVTDAGAVFRADDGAVYRSTDLAVDNSLSEPAIDGVLRTLTGQFQVSINPAQRAALQKVLRDPRQQVLDPKQPLVTIAGPLKDGGLWFATEMAQVRVDASGEALLLNLSAPFPGTNALTGQKITTVWSNLLMIESLLSGLLAILLLVGAILLLRGRPIGRKLTMLWSLIKLPLAVAGAIVLGLAVAEWVNAFSSESGAPPDTMSPWIGAAIAGLAGVVWPLIVLLALTRPSVRDYFKGVL